MQANKCYELYKDLPLKIVNKHFYKFLDLYGEDLYSQAYIFLFTAYNNFDESKNTKFETYAYSYIYYGISRYLDVNLQGHQRRNIKQKDGHFKMSINKPSMLSINAERENSKDSVSLVDNFLGNEDLSYSDIEFQLTITKIIDDLKRLEKTSRKYRKCALILETIYNNDIKLSEIIRLLGIPHNTFYSKIKLIREYIKEVI